MIRTPYKEFETKKVYYSISEVAELFNVNTSLIRFWESEFEFLQPKKSKQGIRQYSKADIEQFKLVYYLVKERGYTLEGARKKLNENKKKVQENMHAVTQLKRIKHFLQSWYDHL